MDAAGVAAEAGQAIAFSMRVLIEGVSRQPRSFP